MRVSTLHLCYASAGAGKTHKLVYTYLRHALSHPDSVRELLAITFTHKATQEMKERILAYLHQLAANQESPLWQPLMKELQWDRTTLQQQAKKLLTHLIHHYDHLSIHTIDSLFQKIVQAFSQELNLPTNYGLLLDTEQILTDSLTTLWSTLPHHPTLEKSLVALALHNITQGKSWDITPDLKALGQWVMAKPWHKKLSKTTKDHIDNQPQKFYAKQRQKAHLFKTKLKEKAHQILTQIKKAGFTAKNFAWGKQGIIGHIEKIHNSPPIPLSTRTKKAHTQLSYWISKQSPHHTTLTQLVLEHLQPILDDLITLHNQHYTHYATTQLLQPLHYALATTTQLQKILQQHPETQLNLPMAHLPHWLHHLLTQSPIPFIYQKLGKAYHSFLIDEFQDISHLQWKMLTPLLQHGLDNQGKVFLVGDTKQAIYRWRGGDAQLFLSQVTQDLNGEKITKEILPYNWRSTQQIIQFNNTFFQQSAHLLTQYLQDTTTTETKQPKPTPINATYSHLKQTRPPHKKHQPQGYVEITLFPQKNKAKATQWKTSATQQAINKVEQLQQAGYLPNQIALLVRNNKEATHLAEAFAHHAQQNPQPNISYQTSASKGDQLADSPHVQLLMHAFQYIHNPEDNQHHTTFAHLYHTYHQNKTTPTPHAYWMTIKQKAIDQLPHPFLTPKKLARLPLITLFNQLVIHLNLTQPKATPYLHIIEEKIHQLTQQGKQLTTLLNWWKKKGLHTILPSQPTQENLQIITIHQAKGLAFQTVIIPFCSWRLDHPPHHPPILFSQTSSQPFNQLTQAPLYYSKQLKNTHYSQAYHQERTQAYLDALNLLYVATTRPQKELYLFAPLTNSKQITTIAHLLNKLIHQTPNPMPNIKWQKESTQEKTIYKVGEPTKKAPVSKITPTSTNPIQTPPTLQHYQKLLANSPLRKKNNGEWWHELLAQINQQKDTPNVIAHYQKINAITKKEAHKLIKQITKWWQNPLLADWFSGRWKVKKEATILLANGTSLRPDRVMIKEKQAIVLDFKTGHPNPAHQVQVATYATLLAKMGYQPVKAYLFYTHLNHLVTVENHQPPPLYKPY